MQLGLRIMSELIAVEMCSKSLPACACRGKHTPCLSVWRVWPEQHIVGAGGRGQRARRPLEPCNITVLLRPSSVRPRPRSFERTLNGREWDQ